MRIAEMPGGKRENPDYVQVSGHVPKPLGLRFKASAATNELTISEALEQAIEIWLEKNEKRDEK